MLGIFKRFARFAMAEDGSVGTRVMRSGIWVGASQVGLQILNLVRSVILAKLLAPEMFGLMGLAMIVVRAIETFTRPGVAQALIARQKEFDEASPTAFTLLVARGFLLAALMAAAAPFVARFYEEERLQPILLVMSLVFVITGFVNINTIGKQRELQFRRLTYLSQITNLIGTIVTVSVAYVTRDVWALVVGQIVTVAANALLSYFLIGGSMRFGLDRGIARELLAYGKFITGSSIILFVATEMDSAVVGKVLGMEQLGFYTMAFTIANLATANLSRITSSIMMPAYSKLQSDMPTLRRAFLRTLSLMMSLVLPATFGLVVVAEPLLGVIYGTKWLPATVPLQILAIFGLLRALASFSGYLFEGIGVPKIGFKVGIARLVVVGALIVPMTKTLGTTGAALTVTVGMALQWLLGLFYLRSNVGISIRGLLSAFWRPTWTAALMASVVYLVGTAWGANSLLGLLGMVLVGVTVYGLLNLRQLAELRSWSRGRAE